LYVRSGWVTRRVVGVFAFSCFGNDRPYLAILKAQIEANGMSSQIYYYKSLQALFFLARSSLYAGASPMDSLCRLYSSVADHRQLAFALSSWIFAPLSVALSVSLVICSQPVAIWPTSPVSSSGNQRTILQCRTGENSHK
jgi:hypothetical protein